MKYIDRSILKRAKLVYERLKSIHLSSISFDLKDDLICNIISTLVYKEFESIYSSSIALKLEVYKAKISYKIYFRIS